MSLSLLFCSNPVFFSKSCTCLSPGCRRNLASDPRFKAGIPFSATTKLKWVLRYHLYNSFKIENIVTKIIQNLGWIERCDGRIEINAIICVTTHPTRLPKPSCHLHKPLCHLFQMTWIVSELGSANCDSLCKRFTLFVRKTVNS